MNIEKRNSIGWRTLSLLASLKIAVIGLSLLLILTVWGTLYQVDNGLYQAQEKFFRSWFFLAGGFLPFPGAQLVMAVVLVNLLAACVKLALQGRMMLGILLTHGGLILMLGAGAVTFYLGIESHLTLFEGESSNVSSSGNDWELAAWPADDADGAKQITAVDASALRAGLVLPFGTGAFELAVDDYFPHSEALAAASSPPKAVHRNASGIAELKPLPRCKEPGDDRPGLKLSIRQGGQTVDRIQLWGGEARNTTVKMDGRDHVFELRRVRYPLPATLQLVDFNKELHPGIEMARSFSSAVIVKPEHGAERTLTISMNKPLRLEGFTFYQSSYNVMPDGREASTFAVVKNYGRMMPYLATFATFFGMVLHFAGRLLHRIRHMRRMEA